MPLYPVALPGASVHYTDEVQATKCRRLTAGVSSTFGKFQSVTDEFWACVFLIPHKGVSRMTATVYPKDERGSGRVSVWYLVMTSLQNHMTFESLWQYFAEKEMTRPLNGLLGTVIWSSRFPLGSRQGCFHISEVSPPLPFCKNLLLFFLWTWSFFCRASQDSVTAFPQGHVFPSVGSKWCNSIKTLRCIMWPAWTMESKPVSLFKEYVREFTFSLCHLVLPFKPHLILIPENFMVHCSPS